LVTEYNLHSFTEEFGIMPKKSKTAFVCGNCGQDFAKWQGRCFNCGEWETITEFKTPAGGKSRRPAAGQSSDSSPVLLSECKPEDIPRTGSGIPEMDRVLGGGLVPGAVILLGGDPGIGKSTLLLQMAGVLADRDNPVVYVTGEESAEQVSLRAVRLACRTSPVQLLAETSVGRILETLEAVKPKAIIIDSIQTMFSEDLESAPGSVSQVRESAELLLRYAKENRATLFLVGHVTKEGSIAGPRVLEHMVDTVLYFEGDAGYQYRILRAVKNRFGPSGEIALFAMSDEGLGEVKNASELFMLNRENPQTGTAFVPIMEGSRVLVVELQALVNRTHFGLPQRVASGINPKRLALIIAVLERYAGISLGDHDVFFNVAGGLNITEPAADLGIAGAILSSFRNQPLRAGSAVIGEIGLGGELRRVNHTPTRLKELDTIGFSDCIVPHNTSVEKNRYSLRLGRCEHIGRVDEVLF